MTTMNSRYLAALKEDHAVPRGSQFELINERQHAAEQLRLEEQAEMRARFGGGSSSRNRPFSNIQGGFETFTKGGV
jgi:hypothetical protein